jgi:hypothetical protein
MALITSFAAFIGQVAIGFVIDSDHWRHFYLLLGLIWGLAVATMREQKVRVFSQIGSPLPSRT